jgi:hypothetical protein
MLYQNRNAIGDSMIKQVKTQGNVIVNDINIGDIHYDYNCGLCIKSQVTTSPVRNDDGVWTWHSKEIPSGKNIEYMVVEGFMQYSPKLYSYEAYFLPQK